jgi:hypothetical protein
MFTDPTEKVLQYATILNQWLTDARLRNPKPKESQYRLALLIEANALNSPNFVRNRSR